MIKRMQTLTALINYLEANFDNLNTIHISVALKRIADFLQNPALKLTQEQNAFIERLIQKADEMIQKFNPLALIKITWALIRLNKKHHIIFQNIAYQVLANLNQFKALDIVDIAWLFAKNKLPRHIELLQQIAEQIFDQLFNYDEEIAKARPELLDLGDKKIMATWLETDPLKNRGFFLDSLAVLGHLFAYAECLAKTAKVNRFKLIKDDLSIIYGNKVYKREVKKYSMKFKL